MTVCLADTRLAWLRFGLAGVLNTVASLVAIYALKWLTDCPDSLANFCGYSLGFFLSFTLNGRWTFSYRGPLQRAFVRFAAIALVAYIANLTLTEALIRITHINSYIAQTLGVVPYVLVSYFGMRYYAFSSSTAFGPSAKY